MTRTRTTGRMRGRAKRLTASLGLALALPLCLAATAGADAEFEFQFGSAGTGAGQFQQPTGLAANASNGKIYVADRNNNRIQVFDETGDFLEAWGYDVVASGENDEPPANEVQRITVKAVGGTFRLGFQEQTTGPIPHNASAGTVEAELDALGAIEVAGGVTVTGGPGDGTGSNPYVVTFAGGVNRAQISMDQTALVRPVGTELECESTGPEIFDRRFARAAYQWIANGDPIPGATSDVYTTTAADAGKAIQCEIEGTFEPFGANEVQKSWDTNGDHAIIGSGGSPTPPLGPASIAAPAGPTIQVGSGGGQTLTCNAGSWSNSPVTYTYQWYVRYEPYGPPTTTSATSDEITLTAQDTAERGAFQCRVKATNASGSSAMWSELKLTDPPPPGLSGSPDIELATPRVLERPSGDPVPGVATRVNGGAVFEICKASPPSTDVCKAGVAGDGVGQFNKPRGIAIDNSPAGGGAVYVGDDLNYRVQKFAADGTALRMFGGRIDKTTGENVCVVASGHDCGAGVRILTHKLGFLRGNPCPSGCPAGTLGFQEFGNTVGVDPNNGNVYVTDAGDFDGMSVVIGERTQAFDSDGNVFGQAFTPMASRLDGGHATSVAVDIGSRILVTKTGGVLFVNVFEEAQFTAEGGQTPWTERKVIHDKGAPLHVSTDPGRDKIWIVDKNSNLFGFGQEQVCGESETIFPRFALVAYDHRNRELSCTVPQGAGQIPNAAGIAVTEDNRAFVSLWKNNVIKVYKLPQETAPTVEEISISEVSSTSIKLRGEISPGFEETEYTFEYGTSPCSSSTCETVPGSDTVNGLEPRPVAEVATGLEPGTKYYYRLVATNPFGTDVGPEKTFTPFPRVDLTVDPCPNALARKQTRTAELLDCRAYELASAGFTGGYDVISDLAPGAEPYDGFPGAGDKVLYSVRDGGIPGTGNPTNRGPDPYVATRGADGWTTEYVGIPADGTPSPSPFSSALSDADGGLGTFAFAESDICSPCFDDESSGIPVRGPDGALEQGMTGSIPQPAATQSGYVADRMSDDGSHLVFGSTAQFEPAGNDNGDVTIYDRDLAGKTTQVVSTLPDGSTMTGPGIGELDISADGSRIVVGQRVSTDGSGNSHWHPYLHVGTESESIDLAPGTTSGVLYLGMSADGTKVFYSTPDPLVGADTDTSVDIYEAEVTGTGPITPRLVSVGSGGPSNSDTCDPVGAPAWNTIAGEGRCNAVGLAGGAGVASDGTVYFLSPELLAGPGEGIADEPNLYVVRPGDATEFVATPDSSAGTSPPPPIHPVVDSELITGLPGAGPLAVDQESGDIYVSQPEESRVRRFTAGGAPSNFTEGPFAGTNEMTGVTLGNTLITQLAIDNAPSSPLKGALYGTELFEGVDVHSTSGEQLGSLTGFEFACGVAVEQSSGVVYVADGFASRIYRFEPIGPPGASVDNTDYSVTSITSTFGESIACQLAADTSGTVYASGLAGPIKAFDESEFEAGGPFRPGIEVADSGNVPPNQTITVDPSTDELYVNNGSKIVIFDDTYNKVTEFGSGNVGFFGGVGVNGGEGAGQSGRAHHAYVVNGSNVVEFGFGPDVYQAIDDPAIVHAVHDNDVHRWSDFQTSRNGDFALLTSELPLAEGYDNRGFRMVHRYDTESGDLDCVSCLPSEAEPNADASMPTHGLGITEDGRAFFNSSDQLVLRDQNEKKDAYEWKEGATSLISTGVSSAPSSMLTVTHDGRDAFFFTRETLVEGDHNGQAMKLYDAREEGGFFQLPPSPPCRASDECHGPGTQAAPPPPIGTYRGTGGNHQSTPKRKRCKRGFVRRKGKCVKKRRKRRAHSKQRGKRGKPGAARGARRDRGGSR